MNENIENKNIPKELILNVKSLKDALQEYTFPFEYKDKWYFYGHQLDSNWHGPFEEKVEAVDYYLKLCEWSRHMDAN